MSKPIPSKLLTTDNIRSIKYFWQDRGDLEHWCDWQKMLPDIERELPGLAKAWRDYKASIEILDAVVEKLSEHLY